MAQREIFRANIEGKGGFFGGGSGIVQIVCLDPVLKLRTLQPCDIVNERGESVKQLEHSREIETRVFEIFKKGVSDLAAAAVVESVQGYIPLVQRARQNVELSSGSMNKSVIKIYKNEKDFQKKKADKELNLSAVKVYPDKDNLSFKLSLMGEDHKIKFSEKDSFMTMYYLLSRCRTLTDQERMTRMIGKGYNNIQAVKDAFENVVIKRTPPGQRTAMRALKEKDMLERLDFYNELISEKTVEDYLHSLQKEHVAATDLAFLSGALQDETPEFVAYFVRENGVTWIINAARAQQKSAKVYQVFIVALECLEAIIDKGKTEEVDQFGMEYVFGSEKALDFIVQQLDHPNYEVRGKVVLLLETMMQFCYEPPTAGLSPENQQQMINNCESGIQSIIKALERHSSGKRKPNMWHLFVDQLKDALELKRKSTSKLAKIKMQYVANIVSLVNLVLGCYTDSEVRIDLRNNLEHAGFTDVMNEIMEEKKALEKNANKKDEAAIEDFEYEFDEFDQQKKKDKRLTMFNEDVDLSNINDVYDFLYKQCVEDGSAEQLAHIFRYLLLIPPGQEFHPLWETCVRIVKEATARAQKLDGSEEHTTYDNLYGYLLGVLNKRESGNDPVSILHKKNAEIHNLEDKIANLEYELEEMRKGGLLASSLSVASMGGSLASLGGLTGSVGDFGALPPPSQVQYAPPIPKPVLDSDLKSLYRLAKHGAPDEKMKEIMAKKKEPQENWDSNIKKVRDYMAALKKWEDAGGDNQPKIPIAIIPAAPVVPAQPPPPVKAEPPAIPKELKSFMMFFKMGLPEQTIKNKMAMKGIKTSRFEECKGWYEKKKAYDAGGPPPGGAMPGGAIAAAPAPPPEIPPEFKKFMMLFKMGLPEQTIKNKMVMGGVKSSRYDECKGWWEKKKAYDAGGGASAAPPAPAAKPPPPDVPADLKKYMTLFKMGLPEGTIKNKMIMGGVKSKRYDEAKDWWEKVKAYKAKYPDDGGSGAGAAPAAPSQPADSKPKGMIEKHKEKKKEKKKGPDFDTELWQDVVSAHVTLPDMNLFAPRKRGAVRAKPKAAGGDTTGEEVVDAKKEPESLIMDPAIKKTMSFFLPMLRRAGITFATLQQNVWNLSNMEPEIINNLFNAVSGDASEWMYIKESQTPIEDLDEPSKMYVYLKNIPRVKQRLQHWQFVNNFEVECKEVSGKLTCIQEALDAVSKSKGFRKMLSCIFECFKANNPKKYEGKKGFPIRLLTSVQKKKITKDEQEVTWLEYIFMELGKSDPEALDCVKDLELMKKALRYKDLGEMKKTVDTFRNSFKSLAVQLKNYKVQKPDAGCTDGFKRFFGTFAEKAQPQVEHTVKAYQQLEADTKNLAKLLGENPYDEEKKINTRYFTILSDFYGHCAQVQSKLNDVEKKKQKQQRLRSLQAAKIAQRMAKKRAEAGGIKIGGGAKKVASKKPNGPSLSPVVSSRGGEAPTGSSVIKAMRNKRKDKHKKRQRNKESPALSAASSAGGLPKRRGLPKRESTRPGPPPKPAGLPPPTPSEFSKMVSPNTEKRTPVSPRSDKLSKKRASGLPRPPSRRGIPPPKLLSDSGTLSATKE